MGSNIFVYRFACFSIVWECLRSSIIYEFGTIRVRHDDTPVNKKKSKVVTFWYICGGAKARYLT